LSCGFPPCRNYDYGRGVAFRSHRSIECPASGPRPGRCSSLPPCTSHIGSMRSSPDDKPKHEEPEHWRGKAVELRRRAMATTDSVLAARLHSSADACALVATELARIPYDAPAEPAWRVLRSSFAAPVAVMSLLLFAWTAQVIIPSTSRVELTAVYDLDSAAAWPGNDQVEQHQTISGAAAAPTQAVASTQNEITFQAAGSSEEKIGHEPAPAVAVLENAGSLEVTAQPPEVASEPHKPGPPAPTRSRSNKGETASSARHRGGGIQVTAAQPEEECRTYVADDPLQRGQRVYGLACRLPNGRWKIQTVGRADERLSPPPETSPHLRATRH
jgi:hypothetical protein